MRSAPCLLCLCLLGATALGAEPESTQTAPSRALDLATYADHPKVRSQLRYFQGRGRSAMQRWLERSGTFLPMIRSHLARADLPEELCWLPMIESGFSNTAVSRKGAVGMWQFMPETARMYGLRVDRYVDERRNPLKSTSAAVRHLSDLMTRFGSPFLAAAAYNSGAGRVLLGLDRLEDQVKGERHPSASPQDPSPGAPAGGPLLGTGTVEPSFSDADFFRLADASLLARETRQYVPRLIAASMIGRDPDSFGFHPQGDHGFAVDSLVVHKATRLDQIALAAGIPEEVVRELNPEYVRGVTPPRSRSIVLLPAGVPVDVGRRIDALPAAFAACGPGEIESGIGAARSPGSRTVARSAERKHVRVRRGESLADVARRSGVGAAELARVNLIPKGYRLHPSQILRLP